MDSNTEGAIICIGALVSLSSSLFLAAALFGICSLPRFEWPSCCSDSPDSSESGASDWCLILAARWFFYKYCGFCCCCNGSKLQDWLKEDLRKLEVTNKFGPHCCQAALQHVVVPEHVAPIKCSKKGTKCEECNQPLVCEKHEEWKEKTICDCIKDLSPE